ncbi:MAG TPA: pyruvate, phosphate dikinase, partial [Dehalococcoidia bacterium]|nr:pyruvate, phosphate dikinase [Dehalococcoidia bacterium]
MGKRKLVYRFPEGDARQRDLLGGKGANLCEMAALGLPVPAGFIITTEAWRAYFAQGTGRKAGGGPGMTGRAAGPGGPGRSGNRLPRGLWPLIVRHLHLLEQETGRAFGSPQNPLLVSVRSGAKFSMPGMMDTVLNLGMTEAVAEGLARLLGDRRFALDTYRRFLQLFGSVVLGVPKEKFEELLAQHKARAGAAQDQELTPEELAALIADFRRLIRSHTGREAPRSPWQQLRLAVEAVFASWNGDRAVQYREYHHIPHDLGTAVTVMTMVMGNRGPGSGSGVCFTRNPATGARELYGEFLANAQGEDVVAGTRTPQKLSWLAQEMPEVYRRLEEVAARLEGHFRDAQDIEFTVEEGKLWALQTRNAQRTGPAAVRIAVEMAEEGRISRHEALRRVEPEALLQTLVARFDPKAKEGSLLLARGFGASPGVAVGRAVFDAKKAVALSQEQQQDLILVRPETSPDDLPGILVARGLLTSRGGITSHAAVVTRGLGKPCIVGCEGLTIDMQGGCAYANGRMAREHEEISIDGETGEVFLGRIPTLEPGLEQGEVHTLLSWADEVRRLGVRANADTPADAEQALSLGAEGIGLLRTEHMLLHGERLRLLRQVLLALTREAGQRRRSQGNGTAISAISGEGRRALARLEELHVADLREILQVMAGKPVNIRLLDAPLHEFLPRPEEIANSMWEGDEDLLPLLDSLREENPMLGHRGARLGLTHPAIYEMQMRAIIVAAAALIKAGYDIRPEVMIPMISDREELRRLRLRLAEVARQVEQEVGVEVRYRFGTMIETPRATLIAGDLAQESDYFSFGSNDLTQTTWAFSRDDAERKFLNFYLEQGILSANPFVTLDQQGVGRLVALAVAEGRRAKPQLSIGICGEHGGDPGSIAFVHEVGLDYVSCSPFRVPVARLAAARAALGRDGS